MKDRLGKAALHAAGLATVCVLAAYWAIKVVTPQPTAAPPPLAAVPSREPDPTLTARLFGLIQAPQQAVAASNIQVVGVFAAGKDSSAVLVVDGKPARAYRLGQEIAPGTRLADVQRGAVLVDSGGARQELRMPAGPGAAPLAGGSAPAPAYLLQGNVLSAAAGGGRTASPPVAGPATVPGRPLAPNPSAPRLDPPASVPQQHETGQGQSAPPALQQDAPRQP